MALRSFLKVSLWIPAPCQFVSCAELLGLPSSCVEDAGGSACVEVPIQSADGCFFSVELVLLVWCGVC